MAMTVGAAAEPCTDEPGQEEACIGESPWYAANRLEIRFTTAEGEADWLFELASGNEYRITLAERFGGGKIKGVIMVLDGRVMLTSGLELEVGSETDSLDAPALVQQMALMLLQYVRPGGRQSVNGIEYFRVRRDYLYLRAETRRAKAEFAPPWTVAGFIDNASLDHVEFDLELEVPDVGYQARIAGRWEVLREPLVFHNEMTIDDWLVWPLTPQSHPPRLKPGWTAFDQQIITLGDLRRIMRED